MATEREQKLVNTLFEIAMLLYSKAWQPKDRDQLADWIVYNITALGFPGKPIGSCWHILDESKEPATQKPTGDEMAFYLTLRELPEALPIYISHLCDSDFQPKSFIDQHTFRALANRTIRKAVIKEAHNLRDIIVPLAVWNILFKTFENTLFLSSTKEKTRTFINNITKMLELLPDSLVPKYVRTEFLIEFENGNKIVTGTYVEDFRGLTFNTVYLEDFNDTISQIKFHKTLYPVIASQKNYLMVSDS